MPIPEDKAKENIDWLLRNTGWTVRNQSHANIFAYRDLAIRDFTLKTSREFADYLPKLG